MLLFWECCSRALLAGPSSCQVLGPSTVPVLILLQESGTKLDGPVRFKRGYNRSDKKPSNTLQNYASGV
eukprot:s167_g6.t1